MIVDTSALVAIAVREDGYERLIAVLEASAFSAMSAVSRFEARIVLGSKRFSLGAQAFEDLLHGLGVQTLDFTVAHVEVATTAYARFGKGNHPAKLNMGDCASYATAKLAGEPLLYVGDDFVQTDIKSALG